MSSNHRNSHTSSSSGSVRSASISSPSGDVPTVVRQLLLSTKQLEAVLSQWALRQATEKQVSDAYVLVGSRINATVHAFAQFGIDTTSIRSAPNALRNVLEPCLAEDATRQTLDAYIPELRRVIYRLLQDLQNRQEAWRAAALARPFIRT
ncbi:hypothetical protein FISHEDRAFT_59166 [Fistulina hepatica ATCC 64428]|uniref:Aip3p/Bud6 N-terminal domain-containing protein n=1 Tax=Fistulina hepatica ATCC 64428 TaxID=1128425 RepID=A0A0D7ABB9_9AGAR|nr:hypothetical protein FISHEDRAFT_59166 [Fistulina hepatica ATCC 64428]